MSETAHEAVSSPPVPAAAAPVPAAPEAAAPLGAGFAPAVPGGAARGLAGLRRAWAHALQRSAGNAALARSLAAPSIQRQPPDAGADAGADHDKALGDIQGNPMFALLPLLEKLDPAIRGDEATAQRVGGPRLVVAIHAVNSKGNWKSFSEANAELLTALPVDQIGDIMRYVGAPAEVKTYDGASFDGRYDAMVDPSTGTLTLIFRVAFEKVEGAQYGGVRPGEKGYDLVNEAAFAEFAGKFKAAIEAAWSAKASLTATCPGFKVPTFLAKVNVVVNSGQPHVTFKVFGITAGGQSGVDPKGKTGELHFGDVEPQKTEQHVSGYPAVTSRQVAAAHEFGHAIGLKHVACDTDSKVCYGTNDTEFGDIMGGGMAIQTLSTTSVRRKGHDDLEPFEKIAQRWGKDVFPRALEPKCNVWSRA